MSKKQNEVVSRYYSASELIPHVSINNASTLIDNDVTTTPPFTNTNSLVIRPTNELDWNAFDDNNDQNISSNIVESNVNDINWTFPGSSLPSSISHPLHERIYIPSKLTNSMITNVENSNEINEINIIDNKKEDVTQQSDQILEITESSRIQDIDNSQSDKRRVILNVNNNDDDNIQQKNLHQRNNNSQRVKKQNSVKKEKRKSRNSFIQIENSPSRLKKSPSVKRVIRLKRSTQIIKNPGIYRQLLLEYAPTSNPISSNDPTDMEADLPPLKVHGIPWIPGSTGPPKLIHASLIPLPNLSSSNKKHTKNSSVQMDKTSKFLLQSFNPRNPFASFMSPNSAKDSQINNKEQESPIQEITQGNRASQIFRRKLMEQSLAMSFGELMTNNALQNQQKPLIRKKTRKGSNARLEDREERRERRRKEREGKKVEAESSNKNDEELENKDKMKDEEESRARKSVVMSKIIDSDKLEKIVVDEIKKRESLISPQPPLRRKTNENIMPSDWNLIQRTETSILPQPPLRRKTNENIKIGGDKSISTEQPPFPIHLTSSRKTSRSEGSKLHVPPTFSVNSASTTPSEEFDITFKTMVDNNKETKNDITEDRTTSPVSSIPVPTTSRYNRLGMGLFGFFNKREQSSQSNQSTQSSSTSNIPLTPKSPNSSSNFSKSPKSPTHFSFLPKSPKSPSFSSFLPRYSRPSSPNPSTSPPSSSRTSQTSNSNNLQTPKSSRATSPNPKTSYSSRSLNHSLSPTPTGYSSSRITNPNPPKSRPLTPNLSLSPRPSLPPKPFSLPSSPVSPKNSSRPLSPLKSPITSKLLRPGYSRYQTEPAVNPTAIDSEKLRKMEKFEAIIAKTEANNKNVSKNTRTGKIRAFKSPITTPASAIPVNDSPKRSFTTVSSSDTTLTNTIDGDNINDGNEIKMSLQSEKIIRDSVNSDIIHFNPDEKENIDSVEEDGVIRFTLTPAVCR